jgi:hypothetical protein
MASRSLSSTAKLLFAAIVDAARGNRSGLCKVANATLADRIGRSESEVGRCLLELEAAGLVARRFGQSKNVRVGVAVTWAESVPQECGTERPSAPQGQGAGSASTGNLVTQGSGPGRTGGVDPRQTAPLSTHEGTDPRPTPAEVAAALRSMVAGRFAPALFDARPAPSQPPPNVEAMAYGVLYAAEAAIKRDKPHRKPAAQQLAELAAWSRRVEPPPSPAPPPHRDESRSESPRIPHIFGDLAKAGKL